MQKSFFVTKIKKYRKCPALRINAIKVLLYLYLIYRFEETNVASIQHEPFKPIKR